MAQITETFAPALSDRVAAALRQFRVARERRALYRRTVAELSALSNRDLADLGIGRSEIHGLAHEAAFGRG